eukprot:scaffold13700_cov252-Ochromonas_danica.AAC.12
MASMPLQRPIRSLASDPYIHAREFLIQIQDLAARTAVCQLGEGGLRSTGICIIDREWDALHPPVEGVPVPRPIPEFPPMFTESSTEGEIGIYECRRDIFTAYINGYHFVRDAALAAVGPAILTALTHPTTAT